MSDRMQDIFLIEDDSIDIMVFQRALNKIDGQYRLRTFPHGEDFINHLDDTSVFPDIMFIDLNTPRMSGTELLKQLIKYKEKYFFPVIVLSTSGEEEDIEKAYENFANGYLTKPISFNVFVDNLSIVLKYWGTVILPRRSKND